MRIKLTGKHTLIKDAHLENTEIQLPSEYITQLFEIPLELHGMVHREHFAFGNREKKRTIYNIWPAETIRICNQFLKRAVVQKQMPLKAKKSIMTLMDPMHEVHKSKKRTHWVSRENIVKANFDFLSPARCFSEVKKNLLIFPSESPSKETVDRNPDAKNPLLRMGKIKF